MFLIKKTKNKRIVINSDFKFSDKFRERQRILLRLPFFQHINELRYRTYQIFCEILTFGFGTLLNVKFYVQLLQAPVGDYVKFFQISPGDYFFSTVKISFYVALLFGLPCAVGQYLLFIAPGLTRKEKLVVEPLFYLSVLLFMIGASFSYHVLIPAALGFFLQYSYGVIEPFLSFDEYFEFVFVLFYSTGLAFQIPVIQIILGLLNVISSKQMISVWRYIILFSTIIGAILTPSTDPITQLILSAAILTLYFFGVGILFLIKK